MKSKVEVGRVIKIISNRYTVKLENKSVIASPRGKLRLVGNIYAGDMVKVVYERGSAIIDEVLPRKNSLTRPNVSNLDTVLIVIAPEPAPDLILVDKIMLNAYQQGIKPVLVFNKSDMLNDIEIESIIAPYKKHIDTAVISAENKIGLEQLIPYVENNVVCLAGQSAVGKTSLMNALLDLNLATDGLAKKGNRGQSTTRHIEMYEALGGIIADTCGFNIMTLVDIEPEELIFYYDEFIPLQSSCKFKSCTHTIEPDCAVKKALEDKKLDQGRYDRYIHIYKELKELRRKLYD